MDFMDLHICVNNAFGIEAEHIKLGIDKAKNIISLCYKKRHLNNGTN